MGDQYVQQQCGRRAIKSPAINSQWLILPGNYSTSQTVLHAIEQYSWTVFYVLRSCLLFNTKFEFWTKHIYIYSKWKFPQVGITESVWVCCPINDQCWGFYWANQEQLSCDKNQDKIFIENTNLDGITMIVCCAHRYVQIQTVVQNWLPLTLCSPSLKVFCKPHWNKKNIKIELTQHTLPG